MIEALFVGLYAAVWAILSMAGGYYLGVRDTEKRWSEAVKRAASHNNCNCA